MPTRYADDFAQLCVDNPGPLPLIERLPAGSTRPRWSARGADLATDTGRYMTYDGTRWHVTARLDPRETAAATAFVIGCSFTAENALLAAGVDLKQIGGTGGVPIYRTNRPLIPAGELTGHLVVSMRSIKQDQVERSRTVTGEFPVAHGEPVHVGSGRALGCGDGQDPDWGVAMAVSEDEVPVYWACGVTPQTVVEESGLPWAAVHAPGHMFITDISEAAVRGRTAAEIRRDLRTGG
ncbi:MAG: D-glutamate cyclase family protein [Propionibacteriaceae bacterium]